MNHFVAFSGGKDSTAMVLLMLEKKMPIDELIHFNGGWEWPQITEHIKKFQKYTGLKITELKPEKSFEWWMYEKPCKIGKGKGFPRFNLRWCTGVQSQTISKYLKDKKPYLQYIGITADEIKRRFKSRKPNDRFPLVDFGINEEDCLKLCKKHGFDFGGLYKYMSSTSCWCCPLQPLNSLRNLYKYFPEYWQNLLEMQKRTKTPFKIGKHVQDGITVFDLDERFKKEGI